MVGSQEEKNGSMFDPESLRATEILETFDLLLELSENILGLFQTSLSLLKLLVEIPRGRGRWRELGF